MGQKVEQSDEVWGGEASAGEPIGIGPYYLDVTEVTNGQFARFADSTHYVTTAEREGDGWILAIHYYYMCAPHPSATFRNPRPDSSDRPEHWERLPAVLVSIGDAEAFAEWAGVALPTEAEWEFAARDGAFDQVYPWGAGLLPSRVVGNLPDAALGRVVAPGRLLAQPWSMPAYDDGHAYQAPVGSFAANRRGIHDLEGNVSEWTSGREEDLVIARGGAWREDFPFRMRLTERHKLHRSHTTDTSGFRCARTVPRETLAPR